MSAAGGKDTRFAASVRRAFPANTKFPGERTNKMPKNALIYRACLNGVKGHIDSFPTGRVVDAGFIYLEGKPDEERLKSLREKYSNRLFVCHSEEWEKGLKEYYPEIFSITRYQMVADNRQFIKERLKTFTRHLPEGYCPEPFDEKAYREKPFGHGSNFSTWEDFREKGIGCVVRYEGEIVASASSYVTDRKDTELDISTLPKHRRKGLALACAAGMLLQGMEKGITVHWDAQNMPSRLMAEKLGYRLEESYPAYLFTDPAALM